jgi:hypothetical protein
MYSRTTLCVLPHYAAFVTTKEFNSMMFYRGNPSLEQQDSAWHYPGEHETG